MNAGQPSRPEYSVQPSTLEWPLPTYSVYIMALYIEVTSSSYSATDRKERSFFPPFQGVTQLIGHLPARHCFMIIQLRLTPTGVVSAVKPTRSGASPPHPSKTPRSHRQMKRSLGRLCIIYLRRLWLRPSPFAGFSDLSTCRPVWSWPDGV